MTDKKLILVVDDDEIILNIIFDILMKIGYEVITAQNGEEALKILKRKRCDLIITDMEMPRMAGIDLLKAVKTIAPETGVIILSGNARIESYIESMNLGAFEYLNKPFMMPELIKIIVNYFNQFTAI